jgi:hypothetical protein
MTTVSVPESLTGPVTPDTRCSCGSVDLSPVVADQAAELVVLRRVLKRYRDAGVSIPAEVTR